MKGCTMTELRWTIVYLIVAAVVVASMFLFPYLLRGGIAAIGR